MLLSRNSGRKGTNFISFNNLNQEYFLGKRKIIAKIPQIPMQNG